MRHRNLPDGGHDKVTWKRSRDLLKRCHDNVTPRRGEGLPQRRYWMFYLWLTGDAVETYHWGTLVTYHWDVFRCFIWNLFETLWKRTDATSLLRPLETSSRRFNKMSWRRITETLWWRFIETSLGVSFETYLRRRSDAQNDVVTTSQRRFVTGWDYGNHLKFLEWNLPFSNVRLKTWSGLRLICAQNLQTLQRQTKDRPLFGSIENIVFLNDC